MKYLHLVKKVHESGEVVTTRNSTVKRLVGRSMEFSDTPLVSVRKTAWKNCIREWEWFMSGSNKVDDLHPAVRHWWEPWKGKGGCVKYNYSQQMREAFGSCREFDDHNDDLCHVDQVAALVKGLKGHPNSRRLILTTWNAAEMAASDCLITNCHNTVTQAFVVGGNRLRLVTYQRSCDLICGLPHNLLQLAAFQLWLCHQTGLVVDGLTWMGGDIHIYDAHKPIVEKMLAVGNEACSRPAGPQLVYTPTSDTFLAEDFSLSEEYTPVVVDKAPMIV